MDFLKKNYEKVVLGLVLAGLVGALVFMLFYINADRQRMDVKRVSLISPEVNPLTNLDLTMQSSTLARLHSAYALDFETGNKVFNPMDWQKNSDGSLIRATKVGPQVCIVTNITPLYMVITFDSLTTNELSVARYAFRVEKQAAATSAKRRPQSRYISMADKPNDFFSLVEVKGAAENPESFVIKLVDSGETVLVSASKANPYRRVDGYSAGFRYDLERKGFANRRVGDKVTFGGTDYVVSEINQNELILADQTNQKKTTLSFTPAP